MSHGCLHLYPEDIERLFREVPVGTPVRVISQEVKAAWLGDGLYVQVHPNQRQAEEIDVTGRFTPEMPPDLARRVTDAVGDRTVQVDWDAVHRAGTERTGLPVHIAEPPAEGSVAERWPELVLPQLARGRLPAGANFVRMDALVARIGLESYRRAVRIRLGDGAMVRVGGASGAPYGGKPRPRGFGGRAMRECFT